MITINGVEYQILDIGLVYHSSTHGVKRKMSLEKISKLIPNSKIPNIHEMEQIHKMNLLPKIDCQTIPLSSGLVSQYVDYKLSIPEKRIRELMVDESNWYWLDGVSDEFANTYCVGDDRLDISEAHVSTCMVHGILLVSKEPSSKITKITIDGIDTVVPVELANEIKERIKNTKELPKIPTHTFDITGKQICLGDTVTYDFDDNTSTFVVVFEDNSFRKKYSNWDELSEKPILEWGVRALEMRLKIVK